jgi:hypothetical protein
MAKLKTVADVMRWLRHDVEWRDIASRDKADQALDVLLPFEVLDSPMVATCFTCQPSRAGTMAAPVPTPTCSMCKKMCIDGYWIDKAVSPIRQEKP